MKSNSKFSINIRPLVNKLKKHTCLQSNLFCLIEVYLYSVSIRFDLPNTYMYARISITKNYFTNCLLKKWYSLNLY